MKVVSDMNLEKEVPRFFKGAKQGLDVLAQSRIEYLEKEVPRFFKGAKQGLDVIGEIEAHLAEIEVHLASGFNVFDSIKFNKNLNENLMSNVLAHLLKPDGTHGQGELFLREFLSDVPVNWLSDNDWTRVRVCREVQTRQIENDKKGIDIEIAFRINDRWSAIAIENKPWKKSTDRDQQLNDYAEHLESMYKGRFKLIYLTPDGKKDPWEASITPEKRKELEEKGKFAKASIQKWASADGWLKRAEDEVKAERVRWFVSDFRKALIESLPALEE